MTAAHQPNMRDLVDRYMDRFRDYAGKLDKTRRFYAHHADELDALQWEMQQIDPTEGQLVAALKDQYRIWLDAMTPAEREEIFAYNRRQEGEWRNHILEEELEPLYAGR